MFPMTITIHNEDQLAQVLQVFNGGAQPAAKTDAKQKAETKKPDAEKVTGKAAEKPAPEVKEDAKAETETAKPEADGKPLTFDDVKAPFLKLCSAKGADAGRTVLAGFKVGKLSELKPEQFADALAAINQAGA